MTTIRSILTQLLSCGFTSDSIQVISETFPEPISWLGMEKQNLTQQKHTFTNQKKCTTTQSKHKKTKARYSRLLRHPAWKWRRPILVSVLHKFVTYLLTYADSDRPTQRPASSGVQTTASATGVLQLPDHVCGTRCQYSYGIVAVSDNLSGC